MGGPTEAPSSFVSLLMVWSCRSLSVLFTITNFVSTVLFIHITRQDPVPTGLLAQNLGGSA